MEQGVLIYVYDSTLLTEKKTRPVEPGDLGGGGGGGGDASAANQVLTIDAINILNGNSPGTWSATSQVQSAANGDAAIAVAANATRNGLIIFNTSDTDKAQLAFDITTNAQFTPQVVLFELSPKQTAIFSASDADQIRQSVMFKGASGNQISINIREKIT